MAKGKPKNEPASGMEAKLVELEELAARKGVQVHYDRLEAAGLKLKGGICKIRGEHHLFIDKRKSPAERVDILRDCLAFFEPTLSP